MFNANISATMWKYYSRLVVVVVICFIIHTFSATLVGLFRIKANFMREHDFFHLIDRLDTLNIKIVVSRQLTKRMDHDMNHNRLIINQSITQDM